jgi:acetyltransferase-like isoleucine patch superfamily enzyme
MKLYLTPYDHAFASGPVFLRPESIEAARAQFDRPEDGDLLWRVFESFANACELGEGLRLSLHARVINKNAQKRVRIGDNCAIRGVIRCNPGAEVVIGDLVYVGDAVVMDAMSRIEIGSHTLLAHGVQILDNDNHPTDAAERAAHFEAILGISKRKDFAIGSAPVSIGRRCWLGFNTAVMKGVSMGEDSIAAAGSMVLKDVPALTLVGGNPARVIKALAEAEAGAHG